MKSNHDFKYEQTLRIEFDKPVGIGSYGFKTDEELIKFINEYPDEKCDFDMFKNCLFLEDQINKIIIESLDKCKNVELHLDWRDDFVIEVHGINPDKFNEYIIQEIDSKIEKLLKEAK